MGTADCCIIDILGGVSMMIYMWGRDKTNAIKRRGSILPVLKCKFGQKQFLDYEMNEGKVKKQQQHYSQSCL